MSHRRVRTAALLTAAGLLTGVAHADDRPTPGASGMGDPYLPSAGNGGYDVSHYDLAIRYAPGADKVQGVATITARATQPLSRFDLDLRLTPGEVTVDGRRAQVTRRGDHELVVTPARPVAAGRTMTVTVAYSGYPARIEGMDGSPWVRTKGGAVAIGEPEIAAWWFPSNDHPRDKATYRIAVNVPLGTEAISNGRLASVRKGTRTQTWTWVSTTPMASYLAFFAAGDYSITRGTSPRGIPWVNAVATSRSADVRRGAVDLRATGRITDWSAWMWGRYPFDVTGGVVIDHDDYLALENQTRPVYSSVFWEGGEPDVQIVVHEIAHQWFGDSVSVHDWRDIWLNEGFATFAEWRYRESTGLQTARSQLAESYRSWTWDDPFWRVRIGDPGVDRLFDEAVYERGGMAVQALRNRIGERDFTTLVRRWVRERQVGNGRIRDFVALAEEVSGEDLDGFFEAWLYTRSKPRPTAANGLRG